MAGGLSDDQVASELTKMVEFIKKEAEEKAKEIRIKAGEEYEIEKANIVRSEIAAIDLQFDQRYKQAKMNEQVAKSTTNNKTRLKVLTAKDEVLQDVFQAAESQLKSFSKDKASYEKLLVGLISEAANILNEPKVEVRTRKADFELAKKAAATVSSKGDKNITAEVDESDPLPDSIAGGVIVTGSSGKISIDNTLEERLKLLAERALPRIRLDLFGPSKSRVYFD